MQQMLLQQQHQRAQQRATLVHGGHGVGPTAVSDPRLPAAVLAPVAVPAVSASVATSTLPSVHHQRVGAGPGPGPTLGAGSLVARVAAPTGAVPASGPPGTAAPPPDPALAHAKRVAMVHLLSHVQKYGRRSWGCADPERCPCPR